MLLTQLTQETDPSQCQEAKWWTMLSCVYIFRQDIFITPIHTLTFYFIIHGYVSF